MSSFNCPHCHEEISTLANVCKACQRGVVFDLIIERIKSAKARHSLLLKLIKATTDETLSNYSSANKIIKNLPYRLAEGQPFGKLEELRTSILVDGVDISLQISEEKVEEPIKEKTGGHTFRYLLVLTVFLLSLGVSMAVMYFNREMLEEHLNIIKKTLNVQMTFPPQPKQQTMQLRFLLKTKVISQYLGKPLRPY